MQTGEPDVYYNIQGQHVDNPSKGVFIRNGKKVVIKWAKWEPVLALGMLALGRLGV